MQGLKLPPGFYMEWDSDILTLFGDDCSPVAMFSTLGADPEEIEKAAEMEYRMRQSNGHGDSSSRENFSIDPNLKAQP